MFLIGATNINPGTETGVGVLSTPIFVVMSFFLGFAGGKLIFVDFIALSIFAA